MDLLLKDKNKIVDVVNINKRNKPEGGANFFDKMDEFVRDPKNVDMVYHLIDKIKRDFGNNFNLIITGKFGDWVFNLIKTGKIKINGIVIHVSGSLRSSIKNKSFQIIGGNENRVYNQKFVLLDDSYYSGSTKKEIDKHLQKYNAKIVKTYVFYDGSFQRNPNVYSVYRYYDYHLDDILPVKKLLSILNNIDEEKIPYDLLESQIMKGQIRSVKELLREIQILKQKFQKTDIGNINIKSYDYKREYENKKINKKYKDFINEEFKKEESYSVTQFWYKYLREKRDSIRMLLKGKEVEFHTQNKNIEIYKGKIFGVLPSLSKKQNKIIVLFVTKKYGVLEVNNDYPIIIREFKKIGEGIKWYDKGKLIEDPTYKEETDLDVKDNSKYYRGLFIEFKEVYNNNWVYKIYIKHPKWKKIRDSSKYYSTMEEAIQKAKNYIDEYVWRIDQRHPGNLTEGIKWYNKGKFGEEEKTKNEDDKDTVIDYLGNEILKKDAVWCKYDKKWCLKKDAIWINYLEVYAIPVSKKMSKETAWDDINSWSDQEVADYIGISAADVDYEYRKIAADKWKKFNEGIKWYNKGKFSEEEKSSDTLFNVGDWVRFNDGVCYWWKDEITRDSHCTSVNNVGYWRESSNEPDSLIIIGIDICSDINGYSGQIVQLAGKWPWFQITNLEHVQ
jgi:hypoxanthine-guanine phosphoribosyltransferase